MTTAKDRDSKNRFESGAILSFRIDRLGGRLNALLTAMRLARAYEVPFLLHWGTVSEKTSVELHHPEDLFSENFMAEHFLPREEGSQIARRAIDIRNVPPRMTRDEFVASMKSGTVYLSSAATSQELLPWETRADLSILPQLMREIDFNPHVQKVLDQIDDKLEGLSFRSYHLRRGDIIDDTVGASHNLWPDKYIPRVIYEWHMQRELKQHDGMLVIFSDTPQETAAFSALSPRVYSFDDLVGDTPLTPLQRDFLELYTMSRSDAIFAPPNSAFSGTAAMLGNKQVTDITADLSPQDRRAAMDALVDRLENRPDMFLGQSDAGQNLPFIARHLDRQGEHARVASIAKRLVEAGMDRAYAYSFLSERFLIEGDLDGCDWLIDLMQTRICHREEHWSTAFLLGAMADLMRGNNQRAIQRFHTGSWFLPIHRLASETFSYMASMGIVTPDTSYPFDPALMRGTGGIYKESAGPVQRALMQKLHDSGGGVMRYPVGMEVRDWRRVHSKRLNARFLNPARTARQAEALSDRLEGLEGPKHTATLSAAGALWREAGDLSRAEKMLTAALDAQPEHPLYLKRYADYLAATERDDLALVELEKACELSGGNPCYTAELALSCYKNREVSRYVELMTGMDLSRSSPVELHILQVDAMRRDKTQLHKLPARLVELDLLAPGKRRTLSINARIYTQLQMWDEALAALRQKPLIGRGTEYVHSKINKLFNAYAKAHSEAEARAWLDSHGLDSGEFQATHSG